MSEMFFKYQTNNEGVICTISNAKESLSDDDSVCFYLEYEKDKDKEWKIVLKENDNEISSNKCELNNNDIYKISISSNKLVIYNVSNNNSEIMNAVYNTSENFNFDNYNIYMQDLKKGIAVQCEASGEVVTINADENSMQADSLIETTMATVSDDNLDLQSDGYEFSIIAIVILAILLISVLGVIIIRQKAKFKSHSEMNKTSNVSEKNKKASSRYRNENAEMKTLKTSNSAISKKLEKSHSFDDIDVAINQISSIEKVEEPKTKISSFEKTEEPKTKISSIEKVEEPEIKISSFEKVEEPETKTEVILPRFSDSNFMNEYYNGKLADSELKYISYTRDVQTKLSIGNMLANEIEFESTASQTAYFVLSNDKLYINPRYFNLDKRNINKFISNSKMNIFFKVSSSIISGADVHYIKGCEVKKENDIYKIASIGSIE